MWWCPTCKLDVPGNQVTYEEYHETCGTYLGDCQDISDEERIQSCVDYLISKGFTPEDYENVLVHRAMSILKGD